MVCMYKNEDYSMDNVPDDATQVIFSYLRAELRDWKKLNAQQKIAGWVAFALTVILFVASLLTWMTQWIYWVYSCILNSFSSQVFKFFIL